MLVYKNSTSSSASYITQVYYERVWGGNAGRSFIRTCDTGNWSDWKEFATDIPSFYKNYNSLDSLSVALGERKFEMGSGVPTIITNIPVNSLDGYPHAYTYIVSLHVDSGDGTIYEFGIIRVGYDGDHVTKIKLSGENIITLGHSEGYVTITKTISTPLFGVITG